MYSNYVLGLGGTGAKILCIMYSLRLSPPKPILEKLGIRDYGKIIPLTEPQVFDMAREDIHDKLISKCGFIEGDQIRILEHPREAYSPESILINSQLMGYRNILRYIEYISPSLEHLGPRKGVKRERLLAPYFVARETNIIRAVINDDYERKFRDTGGQPRALFLVLSAGGGFGAGSIYIVNTIASLAAPQPELLGKVMYVHIPVGGRYELRPQDTVMGIESSKASIGMSFLEQVYLVERKRSGQCYRDGLTEYIAREIGLAEPEKLCLEPVDLVILSGMRGLLGSNIEENFEDHDNRQAVILLTALAGTYQGKGGEILQILTDNSYQAVYLATLSEKVQQRGHRALLYPVETYSISYHILDKRSIEKNAQKIASEAKRMEKARKEIIILTEEIDELRRHIEELKREIESLRMRVKSITSLQRVSPEQLLEALGKDKRESKNLYVAYTNIATRRRNFEQGYGEIRVTLQQVLHNLQADRLGEANDIITNLDISVAVTNLNELIGSLDTILTGLREKLEIKKSIISDEDAKSLALSAALATGILRELDMVLERLVPLREMLKEISIEALRHRRGIIRLLICGAPCHIARKANDLASLLSRIIMSLEAKRAELQAIREDIERRLSRYIDRLRTDMKKKEALIREDKSRMERLEKEKEKVTQEEINAKHELEKASIIFVDEYRSSIANPASRTAIPPTQWEPLLRSIATDPGKREVLWRKLVDEKFREKFASIQGSIEALREIIGPRGAEQISEVIIESLVSPLEDRLTLTIDSKELVFKALGIEDEELLRQTVIRKLYVAYTADNADLAKAVAERLQDFYGSREEVTLVELESEDVSYIAVLLKIMNIPLAAIKEAREVMMKALEERQVMVVEPDGDNAPPVIRFEEVQKYLKAVKEPYGLRFSTLDTTSKDFRDFLREVKESLEQVIKVTGA